jgi:hypothetical protein
LVQVIAHQFLKAFKEELLAIAIRSLPIVQCLS